MSMITPKLKNIFLFLIILWIAHGTEELITGLYAIDSHVLFAFDFMKDLTPIHAAFIVMQIMLWITLIISYLLLLGPKWQLRVLLIPGLIQVYELHHIYKAIDVGGYYPGLYTGLIFPILGYFFWKEWIMNAKQKSL